MVKVKTIKIYFCFERNISKKMYEVGPLTKISELTRKFRESVQSVFSNTNGLKYQFCDKMVYSDAGEGFSEYAKVWQIPGLEQGSRIYVFESDS